MYTFSLRNIATILHPRTHIFRIPLATTLYYFSCPFISQATCSYICSYLHTRLQLHEIAIALQPTRRVANSKTRWPSHKSASLGILNGYWSQNGNLLASRADDNNFVNHKTGVHGCTFDAYLALPDTGVGHIENG